MRWFISILVLLGLALALQAGLVAFAGYVLLGVFVLSRYLARSWIANLAAERECDARPREIGESAEVVVRVRNTGRLVIPWVLTEDLFPAQALLQRRATIKGGRLRVLFVRGGGAKTIKYRVTFDMRGYYQIG